jgi:hypothetical protein
LTFLYASDPQTIQQVNKLNNTDTWAPSGSFTASGRSSCSCYNWNPETTIHYYLYFDLTNTFQTRFRDYDTDSIDETTGWANVTGLDGIKNVNPATQIGYNGEYLILQQSDMSLMVYNVTYNEQAGTQLLGSVPFGESILNGSRFWLSDLPTKSGDEQLTVLGQVKGNDVTAVTRDMVTGQVGEQALPVPDT